MELLTLAGCVEGIEGFIYMNKEELEEQEDILYNRIKDVKQTLRTLERDRELIHNLRLFLQKIGPND